MRNFVGFDLETQGLLPAAADMTPEAYIVDALWGYYEIRIESEVATLDGLPLNESGDEEATEYLLDVYQVGMLKENITLDAWEAFSDEWYEHARENDMGGDIWPRQIEQIPNYTDFFESIVVLKVTRIPDEEEEEEEQEDDDDGDNYYSEL
jgi:hypothetical protein